MSQRNPMNERYNDENRSGKTRKSAASAKPSTARAATVHTPAPKTAKQKRQEARERERKQEQRYAVQVPDNKRIENLPEYKRLRRWWWACLAGAVVLIALAFFSSSTGELNFLYVYFLVGGYALVIAAFYLEFSKMRKLRKRHEQEVMKGKSKVARAQQKAARAEARELEKEAQEKFDAAKAEEAAKKEAGLLGRFRKRRAEAAAEPAGEE